jgi:cytochrome c556
MDTLGPPSAAKPDIQKSRQEFSALARHVETFAAALSTAAGKAPDGITEAMRMGRGTAMGGSLLGRRTPAASDADPSKIPAEHVFHLILQDCTSCHARFREKLQ